MEFLTPELFNFLVRANLIVGLVLIVFRFYQDMTRKIPEPNQHREQLHDESSQSELHDAEQRQALSEAQLNASENTKIHNS
jgi:TRAP-type C4-dicarboxylate transport system permease small subunit